MLILSIETSSARGSIAIFDLKGSGLVGEAPFPEGLVHGREITVHLQALMSQSGLAPSQLAAIAVGIGPGSYTGIRVGVTAAKTLAFALRIPVIPESSLRVMAANFVNRDRAPSDRIPLEGHPGEKAFSVVPVVDGKQRQIYMARFLIRVHPGRSSRSGPTNNGDVLDVVREIEEMVIEIGSPGGTGAPALQARQELSRVLIPGVTVVGDAANLVLQAFHPEGIKRGPVDCDWPRASVLAELAVRRVAGGLPRYDPEVIHGIVPTYLRVTEAERKYGKSKVGECDQGGP